ncbi:LANO_0H09626g1_1 [Lachancea nothofagi CBS 11611]|uniref:LANO_0H09626g1_1 n=1 Tax=Lachancea nothofagi CBS 11611 TaxID=1266666 RepID=A0A1G4KMB8_9SACH|nr:LANO_0H09626g1_1 [Lachancea nothofagi CBS 11611]
MPRVVVGLCLMYQPPQDIPQQIASSGKVSLSKEDTMKSIGEMFILSSAK